MTEKITMSLDEVFSFIKKSLEMGKYQNARDLLEDIIRQYKER